METSVNNKCRAFTSLEQSRKLSEILPIDSADMYYLCGDETDPIFGKGFYGGIENRITNGKLSFSDIPCWSLASLLNVLPEINDISLKMEKVKAKDGYDGYYYSIEYEGIVLIPYSKNPVDACYEMILKLHELNLL